MKTFITIIIALFFCSPLSGADFSTLLGKGPAAADTWLGKPTILSGGMRDYDAGGYGFTLTYNGNSLSKITLAYFPQGKAPKTPQDVARMIGTDITVGAKNKRGILELYFCSGASGIWEMLLTPGDDGYSVVNITPPKN
jgi:hypothetical protein